MRRLLVLQIGVTLALGGWAQADDQKCATCHPKEVAGYARSAMAHSFSSTFSQPDGSFESAFSKTWFSINSTSAAATQSFDRAGEHGEQRVMYVVGSGAHAFGYIVAVDDHLFQSPLSYYTGRRLWDVAPGYEEAARPDFSRPITPECLFCHANKSQPIPETVNRYQTPAVPSAGISCERCHGPAEAHLNHPVPGSILNPAKLERGARDSICEQCHLTGEIRIPNPGKSITDFVPGQRLEESYTTYIAAETSRENLKVVGHAERLALSACARNSAGKLWCGTCHNPHDEPVHPASYFRNRCLTCHGATLEKSHAAAGRDCVSCHMQRLPARDGGHTAFTDHRITRTPDRHGSVAPTTDLKAWREPAPQFRDRNLAIALVTQGIQDSSAESVITGYRSLNRVEKVYPDDPAVLTSLGTVLMRGKQPAEALRRFEKVIRAKPAYAPYRVNAALALIALGRKPEAVARLEEALALDPLLEGAVQLLRDLYREQGQGARAAALVSRYRQKMGTTQTKCSGPTCPSAALF